MPLLRSLTRFTRPFIKPVSYLLAFLVPVLLTVAASAAGVVAQNPLGPAPAYDGQLPASPTYDPAKQTAIILAGNGVTEVSDLLGPYEVLAASDAFNVYVVAPERRPSPLMPVPVQHCCAPMDLVPHYSFAEYEQAIGVTPDLVVVPYIPLAAEGQADAAILTWLRERPGAQTTILSICGGAQMVADAGILGGYTATTHHVTMPVVLESHPEVNWITGVRYVDDGRFITSAGVTSGVDATLYAVQRFVGRDAAEATAQRIGYPHTRFLDDRTWTLPADSDVATLPNLFRFGRTRIGLLLYPGVGELELSSVTDTYPRALATDVLTIGVEREIVRTRHGLDLIPRYALTSVSGLDRLLVPGQPDAGVVAQAQTWADQQNGPAIELIHAGGGFPYDLTFADMARQETRLIARNAARWLEYPTGHLALGERDWSVALLLRPLLLGVLGVTLLFGARTARRRQRADRVPAQATAAGRATAP